MIKPNELTIGRLFYFDGKIVEVMGYLQENDSIGTVIVYIESVSIANERRKPINLEKLNPIPLDPEWLGRCGLKKTGAIGDVFIKDGVALCMNAAGYEFEWPADHWDDDKEPNVRSIEFVHQLQNIFHSLTGEELNVKL